MVVVRGNERLRGAGREMHGTEPVIDLFGEVVPCECGQWFDPAVVSSIRCGDGESMADGAHRRVEGPVIRGGISGVATVSLHVESPIPRGGQM